MEHAGDTHWCVGKNFLSLFIFLPKRSAHWKVEDSAEGLAKKLKEGPGGCGCVGAVPSVPPGPSVPSVPSPGTAEAHKAAESVHFVKEFIRCRVDQPKLGDVKEKPRFGKTMELLENMVGYTHTGTLVWSSLRIYAQFAGQLSVMQTANTTIAWRFHEDYEIFVVRFFPFRNRRS